MNRHERETDARIAIDELLRQSGWNPTDKSMVGIEVPVTSSQSAVGLVDRSQARAFEVHAPVYNLLAAAGNFGPDRAVGLDSEELGWMPVPGHVRLTQDHFVARVEGRSMEPTIPDGSYCLFRAERGGTMGGQASPRLAPRLHRSRARRRVLGQKVHQHEGGGARRRQLESSRDPATAA